MGELIHSAWFWIITAASGISVTGIIGLLISAFIRGRIQRKIAKYNVEKLVRQIVKEEIAEFLKQVKNVAFTQNIQPLVESELVKVTERIDKRVNDTLKDLIKRVDLLHLENKALAAYFDSSLGVTDDAKKGLKLAIANYEKETAPKEQEVYVVVEETKDEPKAEKKAEKTQNKASVER